MSTSAPPDTVGAVPRRPAAVVCTRAANALVQALALRNEAMAQHSRRVARLSGAVGRELGLSEPRCQALEWSGLLHEIGKLALTDRLVDGEVLADRDRPIVEAHPLYGARLVRRLPGSLARCSEVVLQHHERLDGSGSPRGLRGQAVCQDARIVAVADEFDAISGPGDSAGMRHSPTAALRTLQTLSPRLFDPCAVDALACVVEAADGRPRVSLS
jgi:HD-GYP domain-containing protein (c-di-GMP phosphodiesterase class II)